MATMVFDDAYVLINSVDLSDHVQSVTLNYESETVDDTTMGDNTRSAKGSLKNWSMDINFAQDFSSGEVDATLFSIVGTSVAVEVRPVNTSVGSTNPRFYGNGMVNSYAPLGGNVGDFLQAPITITPSKGSGTADLTRSTSST